jgi:hypothetical protein
VERATTKLPPADDRPNVLLVYEGSNEPAEFSAHRLNDKGTSKKQWRDLGVSDGLAGTGIHGISTTDRGAQQLYTDVFGEEDRDEQLFDRQRVADIVAGDGR